ncbi:MULTISPECIES: hypothetical protein [unclassified Streptomyces]|nr:hypothetical protein [Streptomyces sp. JV184]MEE1745697.1 hypothetical protein [Streptomyces sp. JV184]
MHHQEPSRPRAARNKGDPVMVKHYVKYAFSTLTAAMFASMV